MLTNTHNRREFARWLGLAGSAALMRPALAVAEMDESSWTSVRRQFLMPEGTAFLNAANL